MTPSQRKQKGKSYEDKIAKYLHKKLFEKYKGYKELFELVENPRLAPQRDFSSGTFVNSQGDIDLGIAKKFFPFSIECKHWKNLDLTINSILTKKITSLTKIWREQANRKAKEVGLHPLIIFKANYTKDFVFYDHGGMNVTPPVHIQINNWIICLLDDFIMYKD